MSCKYITFDDRKKFEELYAANKSFADIAAALGVHLATVYREAERGNTGKLDINGRNGYSAAIAQQAKQKSIKRRGHRKACC